MKTPRSAWTDRLIGLAFALLAGIAVSLSAPGWLHGIVRAVAIYDGAALAYLVSAFVTVVQDDERKTQIRAGRGDPGRDVVLLVTLATVAIAFASAISILGKGPKVATPGEKEAAVLLAITAVVVGWALIHTLYAFRYAHIYYVGGEHPPRLIFPGENAMPDDYDFLYYSFVVGMTFQVSDVSIADSTMRRTTLQHALISFAFNTAIIAFGVNLVSNLVH